MDTTTGTGGHARSDPRTTALDAVFELAARVGDVMAAGLVERGLTPARAELLLLVHAGGPQVQRVLSQGLCCSPRHVTGLVDALESSGHLLRTPHPHDRRATLVSLTGAGEDVVAWMRAERRRAAGTMFAGLPAVDVATFTRVARHVLDGLDPRLAASDGGAGA